MKLRSRNGILRDDAIRNDEIGEIPSRNESKNLGWHTDDTMRDDDRAKIPSWKESQNPG